MLCSCMHVLLALTTGDSSAALRTTTLHLKRVVRAFVHKLQVHACVHSLQV